MTRRFKINKYENIVDCQYLREKLKNLKLVKGCNNEEIFAHTMKVIPYTEDQIVGNIEITEIPVKDNKLAIDPVLFNNGKEGYFDFCKKQGQEWQPSPASMRILKTILLKLQKLSGGDVQTAIAAFNVILSNWHLYPSHIQKDWSVNAISFNLDSIINLIKTKTTKANKINDVFAQMMTDGLNC